MSRLIPCVVALAAVVLPASSAGSEVYRWRDARGQVHFGDRPPPGAAAETLDVPASPPLAAEEAARRIESLRAAREAANAASDAAAARREVDARRDRERLAARQARCDRAQWALAALETQRPVYLDETGAYRVKRPPTHADVYRGERRYLDDAERALAVARHREDRKRYCAGLPDAVDPERAQAELLQAERCEFVHAELARLRQPEARTPREDLERREAFLREECW